MLAHLGAVKQRFSHWSYPRQVQKGFNSADTAMASEEIPIKRSRGEERENRDGYDSDRDEARAYRTVDLASSYSFIALLFVMLK
jgi:hypothetical protein